MRRWIDGLQDLVFPPQLYCLSCGAVIDGTRTYGLCDDCITKFGWAAGRTCGKCGKPLPETSVHGICYDCRTTDHAFDKGYTCASYGLYERMLISEFKERGKDYIGRTIAQIMADRIAGLPLCPDLITAVPAGKWKTARRGYDQTAVAAEVLAKKTGTRYLDLLERTRYTKTMRTLGAGERHLNVQGAFSVLKGKERIIPGKTVLLVDDVYTTGSTVDACAAVLKAAGAACVDVLTFAAGADVHPVLEEEEERPGTSLPEVQNNVREFTQNAT
ncbi:MAG: double zinc ribbon domain-containing protein [Clostridiales bacterium]|nr:double zinc ribbon domain-containing protein [Clostridiales bacterium]